MGIVHIYRGNNTMDMMTMDEFDKLEVARRNAQADDTPYVGIMNDTINVNGNPNKTEIKPADYTVHFYFPDTEIFRSRVKAVGDKILYTKDGYMYVEREYKGIYITPRRMSDAVTAGAVLESFLTQITDDEGNIRALSYEEVQGIMLGHYSEFKETAYDLVATVLRIPDIEAEWLDPTETLTVAFQIALNNPALMNESDFFTAPSSRAK